MNKATLLIGMFFIFSIACRTDSPSSEPTQPDYPIRPVLFTNVALSDGFWARRIETNRVVTIPFALEQNESTGRLDNFLKAAGRKDGDYQGERYNDTDVYKVLEGAAYTLSLESDPYLDAQLDGVIDAIAAAQEEDGYLFTPRTAPSQTLPVGIGSERWSNLAVSHELYNAGHLYEAAVAHYQATGKRNLLDVAIRNANLVDEAFGPGPGKRKAAPGHEGIEMGLVKLYRVTGEARYLSLARYFLEQRGRDLTLERYPDDHRFAIYNDPVQIQAHRPVLQQTEAVGHAVRAMYLYSGMADVAAMTGEPDYITAMESLWEDVVSKKLYLTGGVGSRHRTESFGEAYELPNDTGYAETCASVGMVFWSWRLFLLHGEARYLDVLERVLYNGLIAGVSIEGDGFFYPNPLESDGVTPFNQGAATRKPWFGTACCPGNLARFLPALPGYIYARRGNDVYVANFISSETTLEVEDVPVTLAQETDYPWEGRVRIAVDPLSPVAMKLWIHVPGWARDQPVPSDLYRYDESRGSEPVLRVVINGEEVSQPMKDGFAVIDRTWSPNDTVEIELDMPVRRVRSHPSVAADLGKVALERGPLVYCVEGIDNGGHARDLVLADAPAFRTERKEELGGFLALHARAENVPGSSELTAIPYFVWSHRGPGEMAVWLRAKQ